MPLQCLKHFLKSWRELAFSTLQNAYLSFSLAINIRQFELQAATSLVAMNSSIACSGIPL